MAIALERDRELVEGLLAGDHLHDEPVSRTGQSTVADGRQEPGLDDARLAATARPDERHEAPSAADGAEPSQQAFDDTLSTEEVTGVDLTERLQPLVRVRYSARRRPEDRRRSSREHVGLPERWHTDAVLERLGDEAEAVQDAATVLDEDGVRVDADVDETAIARCAERGVDVGSNAGRAVSSEHTSLGLFGQRVPVEDPRDEVGPVRLTPEVLHGEDARVDEAGHDLGIDLQAAYEGDVVGALRSDDGDADLAPLGRLVGAVRGPEGVAADPLPELVAPDGERAAARDRSHGQVDLWS